MSEELNIIYPICKECDNPITSDWHLLHCDPRFMFDGINDRMEIYDYSKEPEQK